MCQWAIKPKNRSAFDRTKFLVIGIGSSITFNLRCHLYQLMLTVCSAELLRVPMPLCRFHREGTTVNPVQMGPRWSGGCFHPHCATYITEPTFCWKLSKGCQQQTAYCEHQKKPGCWTLFLILGTLFIILAKENTWKNFKNYSKSHLFSFLSGFYSVCYDSFKLNIEDSLFFNIFVYACLP
jgi:hypothetical protein